MEDRYKEIVVSQFSKVCLVHIDRAHAQSSRHVAIARNRDERRSIRIALFDRSEKSVTSELRMRMIPRRVPNEIPKFST